VPPGLYRRFQRTRCRDILILPSPAHPSQAVDRDADRHRVMGATVRQPSRKEFSVGPFHQHYAVVVRLKVNFGGFVPISTVDWRGRAVCTVFLRGCPARCYYCQNPTIRDGEDLRDEDEIMAMIGSSRRLVSGVVFSGGEPTLQKEALLSLAAASRRIDLRVGLHTNGIFPETLQALMERGLVDRIALDVKTRWDRYDDLLGVPAVEQVRRSLALCSQAYAEGVLTEFEVVVTLFRGHEDDVPSIAREAAGVDLVLQQGILDTIPPFTRTELEDLAAPLSRPVRIRTREDGEFVYPPPSE